MGVFTAIGGLFSGALKFFSNKDKLRTVRFQMVIAAAKGRVKPRVVGGWVCIFIVLGLIGWDIVLNDGENLDALSALLIAAMSI